MDTIDIDFREILIYNNKILSFFGLLPYESKSFSSYVFHCIIVALLTGLLYGGLMVAQLVNMVFSFQEGIVEVVTASYITLTNCFSTIKVLLVFFNRKRILALISSLNRNEFKPRSIYQREILISYIKTSKFVTILLISVSSLVCCFWCVYPLTTENGPFLPMAAYIPYKTEHPVIFALTYIAESIGIIVSAWCCLPTDGLITGFIMVITAQLSLLSDSLKNLHTFSSHEGKPTVENINEEAMIKNIIKCVHNHQEILKFTKEIESLFTVATFGQFSISVLILCTTLFKLASLEKNNLEFFSLVLYIFVITSEVFIFCYFGNEVITKHNELTNSAYHSEWQNCSKTFRKNLIFFMTRSQKTLRLLAGGYVTLSLETFVAIMKSSVSYFTFLNQINET